MITYIVLAEELILAVIIIAEFSATIDGVEDLIMTCLLLSSLLTLDNITWRDGDESFPISFHELHLVLLFKPAKKLKGSIPLKHF